jgi:hypothetical protein
MTYRDLRDYLAVGLTEEQLDQDVTVHETGEDEFFAIQGIQVNHGFDVLDDQHLYLYY